MARKKSNAPFPDDAAAHPAVEETPDDDAVSDAVKTGIIPTDDTAEAVNTGAAVSAGTSGVTQPDDADGGGDTVVLPDGADVIEEDTGDAASDLDDFTYDGDATGDGVPETANANLTVCPSCGADIPYPRKPRKKHSALVPFVISLVVIVVLGLFAAFYFFCTPPFLSFLKPSAEGDILNRFNQFSTAFQNGDINTMSAHILPGELGEDEIPFLNIYLGTFEYLKSGLEGGFLGELDIDYTDNSTMLKSFIKSTEWTLALQKDDIVLAEDGMSAVIWIDETFVINDTMQKAYINFDMVLQDGVWYLSAASLMMG